MSVLSITFHTTAKINTEWDLFLQQELHQMIENLMEVEKYLISEVYSEMISEGKNTNVLLFFANEEKRQDFIEIEFLNISERLENKFGHDLMIFQTLLNPMKARL